MASGVPVVLPGTGGVLSYATPQNAWLAEPTPPTFGAAIRAAAAGDPRRVAEGRATARRFAWSIVAARYFALHDAWLASAPAPRRLRLADHEPRQTWDVHGG